MKVFCIISALFVAVNASGYYGIGFVGPSAHGVVLQGPGSKTNVVGPDGSHIVAAAAGGTVVAPAIPGGAVAAAISPGHVVGGGVLNGLGAGLGHEGQWSPDYNEQQYDDGSYKGDHYEGHY